MIISKNVRVAVTASLAFYLSGCGGGDDTEFFAEPTPPDVGLLEQQRSNSFVSGPASFEYLLDTNCSDSGNPLEPNNDPTDKDQTIPQITFDQDGNGTINSQSLPIQLDFCESNVVSGDDTAQGQDWFFFTAERGATYEITTSETNSNTVIINDSREADPDGTTTVTLFQTDTIIELFAYDRDASSITPITGESVVTIDDVVPNIALGSRLTVTVNDAVIGNAVDGTVDLAVKIANKSNRNGNPITYQLSAVEIDADDPGQANNANLVINNLRFANNNGVQNRLIAGQPVTLSFDVANLGSSDAGASTVSVSLANQPDQAGLSADTYPDNATSLDNLLTTVSVDFLSVGSIVSNDSVSKSIQFTLPTDIRESLNGSYLLTVVADARASVREDDEADNAAVTEGFSVEFLRTCTPDAFEQDAALVANPFAGSASLSDATPGSGDFTLAESEDTATQSRNFCDDAFDTSALSIANSNSRFIIKTENEQGNTPNLYVFNADNVLVASGAGETNAFAVVGGTEDWTIVARNPQLAFGDDFDYNLVLEKLAGFPDLTVTDLAATTADEQPLGILEPGDALPRVNFTVNNTGDADLTNAFFRFQLYLSTNPDSTGFVSGDTSLGSLAISASIPQGGEISRNFSTFSIPQDIDLGNNQTLFLFVDLDSNNDISESDETNNASASLALSFFNPASGEDGNDAFESGDGDNTQETAVAIELGVEDADLAVRNFFDGTEDWVSFTVSSGFNYVVESIELGARADTVFELFDSEGTRVDFDDDGGEGLASKLSVSIGNNDADTTFFLKVRPFTARPNVDDQDYKLRLTRTPIPDFNTEGGTFELDGSQDIRAGDTRTLNFSFGLTSPVPGSEHDYQLDLSLVAGDTTLDVNVVGELSATSVAEGLVDATAQIQLPDTLDANASYTLNGAIQSVGLESDTTNNSYAPLAVTLDCSDIYEDDNTSADAKAIMVGDVQTRNFCKNDGELQDWISFTITEDKAYTVTFTAADSDTSINFDSAPIVAFLSSDLDTPIVSPDWTADEDNTPTSQSFLVGRDLNEGDTILIRVSALDAGVFTSYTTTVTEAN